MNFYPESFDVNDTDIPKFTVGMRVVDRDTGYVYRYMKLSTATVNPTGEVGGTAEDISGRVYYETGTYGEVSDDYSVAYPEKVAGVAVCSSAVQSSSTANSYIWLMEDGYYASILKKTGAITAGDKLIPSSTDGKVETQVGTTFTANIAVGQVGVCTASAASAGVTTIAGYVKCR